MSQFPHDQFAKNLLESLLATFGQMQTALTVNSEVREIDVYFTPNPSTLPSPNLGLLAQCASSAAVFEPFRNPVTAIEIRSCMAKLYDLHNDLLRTTKRQQQRKLDESELPRLWILTPTLAIATLASFGAVTESETWGKGVYLLPLAQKTGMIVIHQLPKTPETLWLRLLGKGKVQTEAIEEVAALPLESVYRGNALELFGNLKMVLESKKGLEKEEQELIMQLSPLYVQEIQAAELRGELAIVLKLIQRRFGQLSEEVTAKIVGLPLERLETLAEELFDFAKVEDLLAWLEQNS